MSIRQTASRARARAVSIYENTLQRGYFRLFGHRVDERFAIVANARTGSNYLLAGLRSSAAIRMYHEIFASHNREVGKDFERLFSILCQPESRRTRMVGFKVFYNHLTEEEWHKLAAHRDLKILHLTRRNRLRTVVSLEVAFKTGQWTKAGRHSGPKEKRVELPPARLLERLEQIERGEAAARARFCDRPVLEIVYEDLVQSPHEGFAAVGAYLAVDDIDPGSIRLKRQNPESLQDLLLNYDEVEAVLRNTRYAEFLDS